MTIDFLESVLSKPNEENEEGLLDGVLNFLKTLYLRKTVNRRLFICQLLETCGVDECVNDSDFLKWLGKQAGKRYEKLSIFH